MTVVAISKIKVDSNIREIPGVENLAEVEFDDLPFEEKESIRELAESIGRIGMINSVTVKDLKGGKSYRLIAGWRRLMAMKYLGKKSIDVKAVKGKKDDEILVQLLENIQRSDLDPISIGKSLEEIRVRKGIGDQKGLAKMVHKSESWVSYHMSMLKADPAVKDALTQKKISVGAARKLASLPKHEQKEALENAKKEAKEEGKKKVTVKGASRQVRKKKAERDGKQIVNRKVEEREREQRMGHVKGFMDEFYGDKKPPKYAHDVATAFWQYLFARNVVLIAPDKK